MRFCPKLFSAFLICLLPVGAVAQGNSLSSLQRAGMYDPAHETVLQGTVVSLTTQSTAAPFGAHLLLQTASGAVDVHLGNAKFLEAANLPLVAGDSVKIVGATIFSGDSSFFTARILQKGSQSVFFRDSRGLPLPARFATPANTAALRGVR